ncbi:MAG: MgtC/SapB family protein [Vicinamibacteria bacterium]
MTPLDLAARFGTALGLGLLLGFERQRKQKPNEEEFAGARTFALVSLLGAAAAHLQLTLQLSWFLPVAFLAVAALTVASFVITSQKGNVGATTEVSALLTFAFGALCATGEEGLATALAVCTLLLLSMKAWSIETAQHIESEDIKAVLKFSIITVIVLPLLPNQAYGPEPMNVLNPYKVWLMVVLISGLNFASYVLVKVLGQEHGIPLTGILGGLVSSTAVTLGFSQRSRREPQMSSSLALGILMAWTVMFFRVLIAVAVINAGLARRLAVGVGILATVSLLSCAFLYTRRASGERGMVKSGSNPFELGEAVKFGLLFGLVTLAAKAAEVYFGSAGLYLAGAIAGLTDVDAIALSMANLADGNADMTGVAARTILIAVMANTVTKTVMAASVGSRELRNRMLPFAALLMAAGLGAAYLIG